jgi:4-hydroxythreonine-4-phosphate dehydrogenase
MGDPAGVGPQIAALAYLQRKPGDRPFYLIAPDDVMLNGCGEAASKRFSSEGGYILFKPISEPAEVAAIWAQPNTIPYLPIDGPAPAAGKPDPASAASIIDSIRIAVDHVKSGKAAAVVTNPINKALLYAGGFQHPGHTEFLAELDGGKRPVMMLVGGGLRVALATIHMPLVKAAAAITRPLIVETARIVDAALRRDFGIARPRIGLCGLNPHAGEQGGLGREEIEIINPAAAALRADGVDISDARPGDTIFHEQREGRWDAVIALYHDQGLIPVKTLDMWGGVNVTLGLSFIRTSPDHGTAYDAARDGTARPDSLIAALALADRMATARANA